MACEIARLIQLPCAEYEFGKLIDNTNQASLGIVSKSFLNRQNAEELVLGNQILGKVFQDYDQYSRYKARRYTPTLALLVFETFATTEQDYSFLYTFIGYLVFDCLIGNTDRHHENWGIIVNGGIKIAPTFDHASGLASKVNEQEAQERLATKDKGRCIEYFCQKAKSAFWKDSKQLRTIEVCQEIQDFGKRNSRVEKTLKEWIEKISQISKIDLERILDKIPKELGFQEYQKCFILKFLEINTSRLKELIKRD
ncbi:HipA domain-containing protein [uncultured Helicobacter sp.]|uniref:HipA domain-containing protein n=1 Tax=uncultured Helicobacter sp. TaxID=175537 RepID=UPI00260FA54E|nr:HipA domain-containing protein [uncultured Helicobacter sp.]